MQSVVPECFRFWEHQCIYRIRKLAGSPLIKYSIFILHADRRFTCRLVSLTVEK